MAALTASGVTINDVEYTIGHPKRKRLDVTLVLSSQGGLTNSIAASLFGLTKIERAFGFRTTSSVRQDFGPNLTSSLDGTLLVAYDTTDATDASRNNPADVTGTFRGYIEGLE